MRLLVITQKIDREDDLLGFFADWVDQLEEKIEEIHLIVSEKGNYRPKNGSVHVYSLGKERGVSRLKRLVQFQKWISSFFLQKKVDVVFAHMCPEFVLLLAPYRMLFKIPVFFWYNHGHRGLKLWIAHQFSSRILTATEECYPWPHSPKVLPIGHGIPLERFERKNNLNDPDRFRILTVGRLSPVKHVEVLIKAVSLCKNKTATPIELDVVGGPHGKEGRTYQTELENLRSQLFLEDRVHFNGPRSYEEISAFYQACDLFVSASRTGGLDKALLEAMASGRLVMGCNPPFKDILGNISEDLFFRKDDPSELCEKIIRIAQWDHNKRQMMADRFRDFVARHYDLSHFVDRLIQRCQRGLTPLAPCFF